MVSVHLLLPCCVIRLFCSLVFFFFFRQTFFDIQILVFLYTAPHDLKLAEMADGSNSSSSVKAAGDIASSSEEELVNINIKTLDSNIFTFRVDKTKPVSLLKETIAGSVGVPPEQQRLIFKGKVLKDDQHLSVYHVEDGDTLHLVVRQPFQSQTQHATSSEDTTSTGNQAGSLPRHRVGHSVVLGLNVGDQGENTSVDISRIIGSVLNSLGIGTSGNTSSTSTPNIHAQASQNANGSSQTGSQSAPNPFSGMMLSPQMAIPNSLTTLSAFISRMEQLLSLHSGYQSSASSTTQNPEQPAQSHSFQYPSLDVLLTVLQRARQLLSGPAAASISHLSERMENQRDSTDLTTRGQVQVEVMHVGVAMQHLGSLLLELGRTISSLHIGESPSESIVNSGPAVYISAYGPNPIMVQPVPNQTNPLFAIPFQSGVNFGASNLGLGIDAIRNINIHMQTGLSGIPAGPFANPMTNTRRANQEQPSNQGSTLANQSVHSQSNNVSGIELQNNEQNVVPQHVSGQNLDNALQTTENNTTHDSDVRKDELKNHPEDIQSCSNVNAGESSSRHAASSSSTLHDSNKSIAESSVGAQSSQRKESDCTPVPLGLGLGGLQPKRRNKHPQGKSSETKQENITSKMSNLILFIFFLMMTTLSPWVGGTQHQQEFDPFSIDLFDPKTSLLPSGFGRNWWDRDDTTTNMHTSVDWTETPESHIFRVDIPGARKDEVNVQVEDGNVLNISGKRTKVEKKDIDTWHLAERKHGGFKRRFKMPENANMDDVECILEHGVLTVTVPKKEIMKPARNVEIK